MSVPSVANKGHRDSAVLRQKAERIVRDAQAGQIAEPADLQRLVHELNVHHVELELQNEELRAVTHAMEASREHLKRLFDSSPVGYVLLAQDGVIKDINQAAGEYFGMRHELLVGQRFQSFVTAMAYPAYHRCLFDLLATRKAQRAEIVLRHQSGRDFWVLMAVILVPGAAETQTQEFFCTLIDISREKEAEHLLKHHNQLLEETVGLRTAELEETNRRLAAEIHERQQAEAERRGLEARLHQVQKFESLNLMAGSVAHLFNNLLTVVLGGMELAMDALEADSQAAQHIALAQMSARRAAQLSSMMLTYSGRSAMQKIEIDAADLLRGLQSDLEQVVGHRAMLHIQVEEPVCFFGDPVLVRQAVLNCVSNSAEAMEGREGSICLRVGKRYCDQSFLQQTCHSRDLMEGEYVCLEVADTGCGIPAERLAKVCDPFFTTKFIGRGLGLPMVMGIMLAHGGGISLVSEPDKGTVVTLLIPGR